jgi:hypothetical protein
MTETAAEAPAEPVPPVLPARDLAVEVEAAPPEAAAHDQAAPEAEAPAAAPELAYSNGSTSDLIVDHFIDSAESGDQSIAQIIAGLGGTVSRNTVESAVHRLHERGRLLRTAPGIYRLKLVEPAKPAPAPDPPKASEDGRTTEEWLACIDAWKAVGRWEGPGNPPGQSGCLVPMHVIFTHSERVRKREQRRKDAEAAAAKRAAADEALRNELLLTCNNNYLPSLLNADLAPVKKAMELTGIDHLKFALRQKVDPRCFPGNPPLASWSDRTFLKAVAQSFCATLVPRMVEEWSAPGIAPQKPASASKAAPAIPNTV